MVQRSTIFRDDGDWIRTTFIVSLGQPFENYKEALAWSSQDTIFGTSGEKGIPPAIEKLMEGSPKDPNSPTPIYFTQRKCRDTSLGGNDAINSYYQYCENDDVTHPLFQTDFGNSGMGRVYGKDIETNQQLLYLSCGLPQYNNVASFYSDVIVKDLSDWMSSGSRFKVSEIAKLAGLAAGTFILLPVLPLIYIYNAVNRLTNVPITKYYDLRPEMPMYYRFVNIIMISLAVNMGLAKDGRVLSKDGSRITGSQTNPAGSYDALYADAASEGYGEGEDVGLPSIFNEAGWDIYRIMLRKYRYEENLSLYGRDDLSTDQALQQGARDFADSTVAPSTNVPGDELENIDRDYWWDNFFDGFSAGLYDANLFVGFRVEKSVDTSETLSNSTGRSPVADMLNSKYESVNNLKHTFMQGNLSDDIITKTLSGFVGAIKGFAQGAVDSVGLSGVSELVLGAGRIDIPDIWTDSQFTKNYSFTMSLRSPYGDPMSIFQSIYIPLALILGASLPRAVGPNAYTSPFLVRAYSKGMLGIPLGIIDSVSIKRGSDQHGWSISRLPTAVDITFTIKDLSPSMYMGMTDNQGIWDIVAGENSTFQEYLMTLGGLGLNERIRWIYKVRRKQEILLHTVMANRLNPIAWGMGATTSSTIGRVMNAVAPRTLLPGN